MTEKLPLEFQAAATRHSIGLFLVKIPFLGLSDSRACYFQSHNIWVYFESEFYWKYYLYFKFEISVKSRDLYNTKSHNLKKIEKLRTLPHSMTYVQKFHSEFSPTTTPTKLSFSKFKVFGFFVGVFKFLLSTFRWTSVCVKTDYLCLSKSIQTLSRQYPDNIQTETGQTIFAQNPDRQTPDRKFRQNPDSSQTSDNNETRTGHRQYCPPTSAPHNNSK